MDTDVLDRRWGRHRREESSMTERIRVRDAEVVFTRKGADPVTAIEGVDLEVDAGGFVSIVGPSGCGKTTLLRAIGGLQELNGGSVAVGQREITEPQRSTAFMFQQPTLLPLMTI